MNRFRARFPSAPIVLPVIHVRSMDQVLDNAQIAASAGAPGVWLVNHVVPPSRLFDCEKELRRQFPDLWVGLNCLDLPATWVSAHTEIQGVWADDAEISERNEVQLYAEKTQQIQRQPMSFLDKAPKWQGIYFGGVAFKGQRKVRPEHWAAAAQKAMPYMDVVTTSGVGTGYAAEVDKIRVMKEAIGDFPLAVASGITPENVHLYLPYVDCFLVATGISDDFENLNLARTRDLVEKVRAYRSYEKCEVSDG